MRETSVKVEYGLSEIGRAVQQMLAIEKGRSVPDDELIRWALDTSRMDLILRTTEGDGDE